MRGEGATHHVPSEGAGHGAISQTQAGPGDPQDQGGSPGPSTAHHPPSRGVLSALLVHRAITLDEARLPSHGQRYELRTLSWTQVEALAFEVYDWWRHTDSPDSYWICSHDAADMVSWVSRHDDRLIGTPAL